MQEIDFFEGEGLLLAQIFRDRHFLLLVPIVG